MSGLFGSGSQTSSNVFGSVSGTKPSGFGQSSSFGQSSFGQPTVSSLGQNQPSFGQTQPSFGQNLSPFAQGQSSSFGSSQSPVFGKTPAFGTATVSSGNHGQLSKFGQPFAFGASTVQSGSPFGQASSTSNVGFTTGFGSIAKTTSGTGSFGNVTSFSGGSSGFGTSVFGASNVLGGTGSGGSAMFGGSVGSKSSSQSTGFATQQSAGTFGSGTTGGLGTVFGAQTSGTFGSGSSVFGQGQRTGTVLGSQTTGTTFGSGSSVFGQGQGTGTGLGSQTAGTAFGSGSSVFGQGTGTGLGSQTTSAAFGSGSSVFGQGQGTGTGSGSQTTGTTFGSGSSVFGQGTGTGLGSQTTGTTFGSGSSVFGHSGSQGGSGFGTAPSFGNGGPGGANGSSAFRVQTSTPGFGGGESAVFGQSSSTSSRNSKASFGTQSEGFGKSAWTASTTANFENSHKFVTFDSGSTFGMASNAGKATTTVFGTSSGAKMSTGTEFGSVVGRSGFGTYGGKPDVSQYTFSVIKTEESSDVKKPVFGAVFCSQQKTGTESSSQNVFSVQSTAPVCQSSSGFGVQHPSSAGNVFSGTETESTKGSNIFGKPSTVKQETSTTGAVSGTPPPPVYVSPSNNIFGGRNTPTQSSAPSIFGGVKVFGANTQSSQSGPSPVTFAFSTASSSVSGVDTSKPPVTVKQEKGESFGKSKGFGASSETSFADRREEKSGSRRLKKLEPEDKAGEPEDEARESDKSLRKRLIRREQDKGSSKPSQSRNLFAQAIAGAMNRQIQLAFGPEAVESEKSKPVQDDESKHKDEDRSEQRQKIRRMSSINDDISTKCVIVCKNIPARFNKGALLRKHFSKFGSVAKVFTNVNKNSATVHFHEHDGAGEAKKKGRVLSKGVPPMQIFWGAQSPSSKSSSCSEPGTSKQTESKPSVSHETFKRSAKKSLWDQDDVDDELASMAGTHDVQQHSMQSLKRPREDIPRSPEKPRQPSPGRISPAQVSVSSILNAVANSVHDRVQLLDQRDKLFRQGRKKQVNLATAKAFVGKCMDMCPEKERYDREDKRRLAVFEIVPGTENNPKAFHARVVKEYSRSSADQDEPLPHELRPAPVLMRTMTYLLSEIADRGDEGKWADWYGYLWDRTRGLRKDITQQQLCNRAAVELIEKCARFHIYCSERLCEEDMAVFDQKINNENLTKCLQTLKEFYYDLETKQNTFCPNEAEFRAYMVLMNLNEGDTLREVQQLRPDVRNTREINFAIKVYTALNSNNYVRFFRLIQEASFLSGCIVHRYFTQVRSKALNTLLKAYGGGKVRRFPLNAMIRLLAFEDSQEAAYFCEFYGLSVEDGDVILDKSTFYNPESALSDRRSISLIESKRMVAVGEVMNGEKLPPLELSEPTCSFDEHGRFQISRELLQYVDPSKLSVKVSQSASPEKKPPVQSTSAIVAPPEAPPEPVKLSVSNDVVKSIAKELFFEVIDEFAKDISSNYVHAVQVYLHTGKAVVEELVILSTASLIRDLCTEVYQEEKLKKEKIVEAERQAAIDRVSSEICNEVISTLTEQESRNLATAEVREIHAQLKKERTERCTESISEEILENSITDLIQEISLEVHQHDVVQRLRKLEGIENCVKLHRAGRFLQIWKKEYAARLKLKRAMLAFPCAPSSQTVKNQLSGLLPDREHLGIVDRSVFVNKCARLEIQTPMELERREVHLSARLSLLSLYRRLCMHKAWQPFDLSSVAGKQLQQVHLRRELSDSPHTDKHEPMITWKLLLSLPEAEDSVISDSNIILARLNKWLCAKFRKGALPRNTTVNYKGEVLCLYHSSIHVAEEKLQDLQMGVCVRNIVGTLQENEVESMEKNRLLLGSSGIIFVVPPATSESEDSNFWLEAMLRLARILQAKPMYPSLPLVIIIPEAANQNISIGELCDRLNLESYLKNELISDIYKISVRVPGGEGCFDLELPHLSEKLCSGLQWLASQVPSAPDLRSKPIGDFIEDFLLEEYSIPVLQDLRQRKTKGYLHQSPNILLTLYNTVIEHLAEVASSSDLKRQSWPIPEFGWTHPEIDLPPDHWNTAKHLAHLYQEISLLQLPRFMYLDFDSDTWDQVCLDVWAYIACVVAQNKSRETVNLVTRIKNLLRKVREEFEDTCYLVEREDRCEPTYVNMPWTDVIEACISFRLGHLNVWNPLFTGEDSKKEVVVYYDKEDMRYFDPPVSWKDATVNTNIDMEDEITISSTMHKAAEMKQVETSIMSNQPTSSIHESVLLTDVTTETKSGMAAKSVADSLLQSIQNERKESDRFQQYLESELKSGSMDIMNQTIIGEVSSAIIPMDQDISFEHEAVKEEGSSYETLSEKLASFQAALLSQKKVNDLYEKRLQFLLNS